MNFKEVVAEMSSSLMTRVSLVARYGDLPMHHLVLLHKLEKHQNNPRGMAKYLAAFWGAYPPPSLTEKAKVMVIRCGDSIRCTRKAVGYMNSDGTYHWFDIE